MNSKRGGNPLLALLPVLGAVATPLVEKLMSWIMPKKKQEGEGIKGGRLFHDGDLGILKTQSNGGAIYLHGSASPMAQSIPPAYMMAGHNYSGGGWVRRGRANGRGMMAGGNIFGDIWRFIRGVDTKKIAEVAKEVPGVLKEGRKTITSIAKSIRGPDRKLRVDKEGYLVDHKGRYVDDKGKLIPAEAETPSKLASPAVVSRKPRGEIEPKPAYKIFGQKKTPTTRAHTRIQETQEPEREFEEAKHTFFKGMGMKYKRNKKHKRGKRGRGLVEW